MATDNTSREAFRRAQEERDRRQRATRSTPSRPNPFLRAVTGEGEPLINGPAILDTVSKRAVPAIKSAAVHSLRGLNPVSVFMEPVEQGIANATGFRRPKASTAPRATPSIVGPSPFEAIQAGSQSGQSPDYYSRILQIEGGMDAKGNFRISPKGAFGPAQLMPGTAPEAARLAGVPYDERKARTDAAYNTRLGKAYYDEQLRTFGDPVLAAAAYNAGPGAVRAALAKGGQMGWLQHLPQETQQYVQNFAGGGPAALGQTPPFQNPFDPSYGNKAIGMIGQAGQIANTPFDINLPSAEPPPFPGAPELPKRDFSKTDELLETLKPTLISEVEQKRISRANLFAGLAKGLASIPEGAGLGTVLGRIGAGMLAGRAAGDAEVQARMDAFDEKMAAWNLTRFNYESGKSQALFADATNEVKLMYEHNLRKFDYELSNFLRDNTVQVMGNYIAVGSKTDAGRQIRMIPISPMIQANTILQQAEVVGQMGGQAQAGASIQAGATNQYMAGMYMNEWALSKSTPAGQGQDGIQSFLASAATQAGQVVSMGPSAVENILGQDNYQNLLEHSGELAMREGFTPGSKEYTERVQKNVQTEIMDMMLQNSPAGAAVRGRMQTYLRSIWQSYAAQRAEERRVQRRTDNRGRTTVTETQDGY